MDPATIFYQISDRNLTGAIACIFFAILLCGLVLCCGSDGQLKAK